MQILLYIFSTKIIHWSSRTKFTSTTKPLDVSSMHLKFDSRYYLKAFKIWYSVLFNLTVLPKICFVNLYNFISKLNLRQASN